VKTKDIIALVVKDRPQESFFGKETTKYIVLALNAQFINYF
jgi:hypothetical protein